MKIYYTLFLVTLNLSHLKAQTNLDSLWGVWENSELPDTVRLEAIYNVTLQQITQRSDSAFITAQIQHDFAKSKGVQKYQASSLELMGHAYKNKNKYEEALGQYKESYSYYQKIQDKQGLISVLWSLGDIYVLNGAPVDAHEYYTLSYKLKEEVGGLKEVNWSLDSVRTYFYAKRDDYYKVVDYIISDSTEYLYGSASTEKGAKLTYVGYMHSLIDEYDKALNYYQKSLNITEQLNDKKLIAATLDLIGRNYKYQFKYNLSVEYSLRSHKIWKELDNKEQQVLLLYNIAQDYRLNGDYSNAIEYNTLSLELAEKIEDKNIMASALNSLATIYSNEGNYTLSLEYLHKSLTIFSELGMGMNIGMTMVNIGNIYYNQNEFTEAIEYYEQSLAHLSNTVYFPILLCNIGSCFYEQKKYEKAFEYNNRALTVSEETGYKRGIALALNNKAKINVKLGKWRVGLDQFNRSLELFKEQSNKKQISDTLNEIAKIYLESRKYREALQNSKEALSISQKINTPIGIKNSAHTSYLSYKNSGNPTKALEMLELYLQTRDSLESDDKKKELIRLEFQYEYDKEKQALAFQQEQERLIQEQEVSRLQWIIYGSIGAFVLMMLLAFVIYRNYRGKRRSNALLREQNKEIVRQKQELQELDQFKSRFFANISHELRTPLTLITGPLENLLERPSAEEMDKTLPLVLRNTKKLKSLVNDILDLSKLEKGKIELQESPVQIKAFLNRLWSNYESMTQQLSIEYAISIERLHSTWVLLDSKRVEKIINNLIFNAIKHTPTGGKIDLMASQKESIIVIHVADTGQGIAKEDLPYIFDRYFQSKQPDAPIQGGTGIGLALAHELTYLMGGELTVESELHKGTTFTFTLPLKETDVPAEETEPTVANADGSINPEVEKEEEVLSMPLDQKKHKILIVEDNNDMRHYINGIVKKNHLTTQANHGKEALEILKTTSFDLIITDVMMPEMDGYTLVKHLKDDIQWQGIPVIMLTALDMEDKKLEALTLGVDDYLTKPFSPKELETRINNLLARYKEREKWIAESNHDETEKERVEDQHQETIIDQGKVSKQGLQWLETVRDIILKELENPDFRIVDLADEFHLSERQFLRKFKTLTGLTPKQFQQEVALQKARELLEKGTYHNVSAVAYSVGLQNVSRFSKAYVERFGKNPKAYFE